MFSLLADAMRIDALTTYAGYNHVCTEFQVTLHQELYCALYRAAIIKFNASSVLRLVLSSFRTPKMY
jgi:hypothetical protein